MAPSVHGIGDLPEWKQQGSQSWNLLPRQFPDLNNQRHHHSLGTRPNSRPPWDPKIQEIRCREGLDSPRMVIRDVQAANQVSRCLWSWTEWRGLDSDLAAVGIWVNGANVLDVDLSRLQPKGCSECPIDY